MNRWCMSTSQFQFLFRKINRILKKENDLAGNISLSEELRKFDVSVYRYHEAVTGKDL